LRFGEVFLAYAAGFLLLILLAAWATGRKRKRLARESWRRAVCPVCGAVAHPRPRVARVRCASCGVRFHTAARE
jgi:ribosomal protein L37AE/L43A